MSAQAYSHEEAHSHGNDHGGGFKYYLVILVALLILTVITVGASYFDFGSANMVIAVFIASIKATLVALFFMHLKDDKPINGILLVSCFMFLGLLLTFCLLDVENRSPDTPSNKAKFSAQGPPSMGYNQTATDKIPPPNKGTAPAGDAHAPAAH